MKKSQILRVLRFLRVTDSENNLSLTNLALVVTVVNLTRCTEVRLEDMLTFVATVAGYQARRFLSGKEPSPTADADELKAAIAAIESKVAALQVGRVLTKPGSK